jgi:uncharacterized protein (TIGR02145 family)
MRIIRNLFLFSLLIITWQGFGLPCISMEIDQEPVSAAKIIEKTISESGVQKAKTVFQKLIEDKTKYSFVENEFNSLGYKMLYAGKTMEAVVVLSMALQVFPEAWNLYDSLGEVYMYAGEKEKSKNYYRKSLELNPDNFNATWKLDDFEKQMYQVEHETKEFAKYEPGQQTGLMGPYLGQKPPGMKPEVFAPGIVSLRMGHEFSCTFSPDGKEFYFNRGPDIWVSYLNEQGWTAPQRVDFNTAYLDHEPHITADGKKLFFGTGRPREDIDLEDPYGIWVMDRKDEGWGNPVYHGTGMYVTTSKNGNFYVTDVYNTVGGGICMSTYQNGKYLPLKQIKGEINEHRSAHPCIAWDESFLIFDSYRPDALGGENDDDLYVTFRNEKGDWGEVMHLEDISTIGPNMTASLSPDGKYLFYYANHDIYWVSIKYVLKHKPDNNGLADLDGNEYQIVKIGDQVWMAENLKVRHTPCGKEIESFVYMDNPEEEEKYGRLYTWKTAMNNAGNEMTQGICPNGWHLPSDSEWKELIDFVGKENGKKLLKSGTTGFDALLEGGADFRGNYLYRDEVSMFWSSTDFNEERAPHWGISADGEMARFPAMKGARIAIRCIKNKCIKDQ